MNTAKRTSNAQTSNAQTSNAQASPGNDGAWSNQQDWQGSPQGAGNGTQSPMQGADVAAGTAQRTEGHTNRAGANDYQEAYEGIEGMDETEGQELRHAERDGEHVRQAQANQYRAKPDDGPHPYGPGTMHQGSQGYRYAQQGVSQRGEGSQRPQHQQYGQEGTSQQGQGSQQQAGGQQPASQQGQASQQQQAGGQQPASQQSMQGNRQQGWSQRAQGPSSQPTSSQR